MADAFTISVPTDARYRVLASEIAGKYVELVGGTAADGTALATAVAEALDRAATSSPGEDVVLEFRAGADGVGVTVRHGGRSAIVSHPLPARNA
jgi:anti-sigma regulatory factor (Ser/Thr protein kinase)